MEQPINGAKSQKLLAKYAMKGISERDPGQQRSPDAHYDVETGSAKAIKTMEGRQDAKTSSFADQDGKTLGTKKDLEGDYLLAGAASPGSTSRRSAQSGRSGGGKDRHRKLSANAAIIRQIEEDFKQLKHLPKQKLHPFDFTHEELTEIKQHFPEFKATKSAGRGAGTRWNGIRVDQLKQILSEKIKISEAAMQKLVTSLDHKNEDKISWNEFLNFLTNEGVRRETVNDAQLYGFGVKRLERKLRHRLAQDADKAVEYYIDSMVFIRWKNCKLLLNVFENEEAKLFDLKTFQPIQDLVFSSDYAVPKERKVEKPRAATASTGQLGGTLATQKGHLPLPDPTPLLATRESRQESVGDDVSTQSRLSLGALGLKAQESSVPARHGPRKPAAGTRTASTRKGQDPVAEFLEGGDLKVEIALHKDRPGPRGGAAKPMSALAAQKRRTVAPPAHRASSVLQAVPEKAGPRGAEAATPDPYHSSMKRPGPRAGSVAGAVLKQGGPGLSISFSQLGGVAQKAQPPVRASRDAAEPTANQDLSHGGRASRVPRASAVAKKNLLMQGGGRQSAAETGIPHSRAGLNARASTALSSNVTYGSKKGAGPARGALASQWSAVSAELDDSAYSSVPPPAASVGQLPVASGAAVQGRGAAGKRPAFARSATSTMLEAAGDDAVPEIAHPQIVAWKLKDSFHLQRAQQRLQETQKAQEREEDRMTKSRILGLANLHRGDSAREFMLKSSKTGGEGGQAESNPLLRTFNMAGAGAGLKEDYRDSKKAFEAKFESLNKELGRYDGRKEAKFRKTFKVQEKEHLARQGELRQGAGLDPLGGKGRKKKPGASADRHDSLAYGTKRPRDEDYIDYLGNPEIVARVSKQISYIPKAMRRDGLEKLCDDKLEELRHYGSRVANRIDDTVQKAKAISKRAQKLKDTNRFFYKMTSATPYYYPEAAKKEENEEEEHEDDLTNDSTVHDARDNDMSWYSSQAAFGAKYASPKEATQTLIEEHVASMLKDNYKQDVVKKPVSDLLCSKEIHGERWSTLYYKLRDPSWAGRRAFFAKLSTEEGRTLMDQLAKELKHEEGQAPVVKRDQAMAHTEGHSKKEKIKHTKAIYTVSADFQLIKPGTDEEVGIMGLALIDRQVLVYYIKQNGTKINLMEKFSFYVNFPNKGSVSSLSIEQYVSNGRPIICIGSQNGDIAIYYLDGRDSKGKLCQRLIDQFNFFERGPARSAAIRENDGAQEYEDDYGDLPYKLSDASPMNVSASSNEKRQFEYTLDHDLALPAVDATKQIQDEYWEVLMNTRSAKDGVHGSVKCKNKSPPNGIKSRPNGITLWNAIYPKLRDQESSIKLCRELISMKLESTARLDQIVEKWQSYLTCYDGNYSQAIETFRLQVARMKNEERSEKSTRQGTPPRGGAAKRRVSRKQSNTPSVAASSKPSRQGSGRRGNARRGAPDYASLSNIDEEERQPQPAPGQSSKGGGGPQVGTKRNDYCITKLKYVKDIGLIASAFNGTIKFFDAFNFYQTWKTENKTRTPQQHTSIATFDVSSTLGVMATGGSEGVMLLIDPYALGIVGAVQAHYNVEILNVFLYDQQHQIITVAEDRTICLWDAQRLEKLQTIKDEDPTIHVPKFASSCFDQLTGQLYVGCQQISIWRAVVDPKVEIHALQIQTLSKAMLEERNMTAFLKLAGPKAGQTYKGEAKNGNVLISSGSALVDIMVNEGAAQAPTPNYFITVDSENLLRFWNIAGNQTAYTYRIPMKRRVTAVAVNAAGSHIAVGNAEGRALVLNAKSGGVLYELPHQDQEITSLKFLSGLSEFWLVAGCWQGKMVFWTEPNEQNNFQITAKCRLGHRGDIMAVEHSPNCIVSGGMDGLLSVWNQFSGALKYAIKLPDPAVGGSLADTHESEPSDAEGRTRRRKGALQLRKTVVGLLFHPYYRNVVLVLQEGGSIHAVDVSNGMIAHDHLGQVQMNSNWACDEENYRVLVVGDLGKAILLDCRMGAAGSSQHTFERQASMLDPQRQAVSEAVTKFRIPIYRRSEARDDKWKIVKSWFKAHQISKVDPNYVNSVQYSHQAKIYVTGTNYGEVSMWDGKDCMPLGTLNSPAFDGPKMEAYLAKHGPKPLNGANNGDDDEFFESIDVDLDEANT